MNYALHISYDGGRYFGWQRLPGEDTVQGRIENVVSRFFECNIEISGSGRTDKGVHAKSQWAAFKHEKCYDPRFLRDQLNSFLPVDIRIVAVYHACDSFHPRYNALSKTYVYRVETGAVLSPFEARYGYHLGIMPDITLMKMAAQSLLGHRDFAALSQAKSKKKSTMRTIKSIDFVWTGSMLEIRCKADGFLYNMMRRIATVLVEIGLKRVDLAMLEEALTTQNRGFLSYQLPPQGLFLEQVDYDPEQFYKDYKDR